MQAKISFKTTLRVKKKHYTHNFTNLNCFWKLFHFWTLQ